MTLLSNFNTCNFMDSVTDCTIRSIFIVSSNSVFKRLHRIIPKVSLKVQVKRYLVHF